MRDQTLSGTEAAKTDSALTTANPWNGHFHRNSLDQFAVDKIEGHGNESLDEKKNRTLARTL